jgi:shikimate kinase
MAGNSRSADVKGPVLLIGMMGSGKTSVGTELARLLGWPWMDLDQALERRFKRSVAEQFKRDGEKVFRRRERDLLKECCKAGPRVLSAGGGVVLDASNRALLRRRTTVYLQAAPGFLAERLKGAELGLRPLLSAAMAAPDWDLVTVLRRMAARRGALYRSCARITVRASQGTAAAVAGRIVKRLGA